MQNYFCETQTLRSILAKVDVTHIETQFLTFGIQLLIFLQLDHVGRN